MNSARSEIIEKESDVPDQADDRRWAAGKGFSLLRERFRQGKDRLPEGAWKRWALLMTVGLVFAMLVTWGLTWIGQWLMDLGLQSWDERILRQYGENGPFTFVNGIKFESPGNLTYLLPLIFLCAVVAVWRYRPITAVTIVLAYAIQRPLIWFGWWLWDRSRPDFIAQGIASPDFNAFPSGHAGLSALVYGFIAWFWMRASRSRVERALILVLYLTWIGVIGLARLALGSHWPSDVIAGYVQGMAWLGASLVAIYRSERR